MARIQVSNDLSGPIAISFPYDPVLVGKVKTIDGHRCHSAEKYWSFPNRENILQRILKVFAKNEAPIAPAIRTATSIISPIRNSNGGALNPGGCNCICALA